MHFVSQFFFVIWALLMVVYVTARLTKAQSVSFACGPKYRVVLIVAMGAWILAGTISGLFKL